jgi:hypothetical protein
MSSGEKAKPPATFEERNPFDISRRSGPEVAAEIAKRMVAWKQARVRTSAAPTTIPGGDAKSPSGAAKSPPIAAPVQPARMPKSAAPAPQPAPTAATRSARSSTPGVPYFASASATRRAMPPAPSLKQGSARPQAGDELAVRADEAAIPIAASVPEQASPRHDESRLDATDAVTTPETLLANAPAVAAASIEETPPKEIQPEEIPLGADDAPAAAPPELSIPVESPSVAETSEPTSVEPDDNERRRAEARAIKARWMAARDLDALIDTSGAGRAPALIDTSGAGRAPAVEAAMPAAIEAGSGEGPDPSDHEPERAATLEAAANIEEPAAEVASESAAAARVPADVPDDATGRLEPTFDAPNARATPAPVVDRDVARQESALDLAALDEIAGRREPTFEAPTAQATAAMAMAAHPEMPDAAREPATTAQDEAADDPRSRPAANAAAEPAALAHRDATDEGPSLAALYEVAGRKEPTFDKPIRREALEIEPPVHAAIRAREVETPMAAASDVTPEDTAAPHQAPQLSIAALDEAAGRKEPTFDEPALPADTKPAAAPTAAPRIALRPIETRIEARRVDTLRAEPQLSARRPIFPHIEPDEWDVPPVVAARASRARRGTGWAIGLGSVLLIAGITAPAAIWQQGRHVQDQVALVNPAPPQIQTPAPTATTTAQVPAQVQATLPEAPQPETPQPETPPAAPAVTTQEPSGPTAPTSEAGQVAANPPPANPKPATTLGAVGDGGEVNEAPVVAPPSPTVNLASRTDAAAQSAPMVARPFVPEQSDGPFLQAPTTGATSVPVAGAPVQAAAVGVKPNLMGQLKPKATVAAAKPVASKPQPVARKPKPFLQQSPDQMFETLIETLSEGKPVNPRTKPAAPSNRR